MIEIPGRNAASLRLPSGKFVLTVEARAILVAVKFVSSCDKLICSDFLSSHLAIESCKIQITVFLLSLIELYLWL
jgi:hypothetical protein